MNQSRQPINCMAYEKSKTNSKEGKYTRTNTKNTHLQKEKNKEKEKENKQLQNGNLIKAVTII